MYEQQEDLHDKAVLFCSGNHIEGKLRLNEQHLYLLF
jgi:hypothetical protein